MNNANLDMGNDTYRPPPDIFHAAEHNDIEELLRALQEGQSLSETKPDLLDMTPVHLACVKASVSFIKVAIQHPSFHPWIRDANLRTAFDHARARSLVDVMVLLENAMYPDF